MTLINSSSGKLLLALLLGAAGVSAQTPSGFVPAVNQSLKVSYGSNDVSPAGELIPRPETAATPSISIPDNTTTSANKGLLVLIDLDVPRNNSRVTNLHWLAPDVDISKNPITVPTTGGVSYRQPSPPVGDFPHRYVFLLYSQPSNFSIPAQFSNLTDNRIGFNISSFASAASLRAPFAANYITVQNTTGNATTTFPPITSATSPPRNGSSSSSSAAGAVVTQWANAPLVMEIGALAGVLLAL